MNIYTRDAKWTRVRIHKESVAITNEEKSDREKRTREYNVERRDKERVCQPLQSQSRTFGERELQLGRRDERYLYYEWHFFVIYTVSYSMCIGCFKVWNLLVAEILLKFVERAEVPVMY